jgi:hypothetical protein
LATPACPACGTPLTFVAQYNAWWCARCNQYRQPSAPAAGAAPAQPATPRPGGDLWLQNFYRLRKKVLALAGQYWIEDQAGRVLGYSKQKLLRLKEDIRVYTGEDMTTELFQIRQQQILDAWATFAVVDSPTNSVLGYVRRKALSSAFVRDEWDIRDPANNLIGGISESTGRGLARKWLPGGALIPEKTTLELGGRPVATINQQFKVIGDIWEVSCQALPPAFDRRVLLGGALLMSLVERARK